MATSVTLTQIRSVVNTPGDPHEGQFKMESEWSDADVDGLGPTGNWDNSFFLFAVTNDVYQHVCTVGDLENYQVGAAAAIAAGDPYYRADVATLYFSSLTAAWSESALQKTRGASLCTDWQSFYDDPVYGAWVGTDVDPLSS